MNPNTYSLDLQNRSLTIRCSLVSYPAHRRKRENEVKNKDDEEIERERRTEKEVLSGKELSVSLLNDISTFAVWFVFMALTIVGYLMPNLVFIYISNIWFVNTFCRYTWLNDQTIPFLTIQLTKLNSSKYWYVSLTIQLNISHSFTHSWMIKQFYF